MADPGCHTSGQLWCMNMIASDAQTQGVCSVLKYAFDFALINLLRMTFLLL